MKPEAQRIAIAEACGWTAVRWADELPDCLNDLNAMHEAEKTLSDGQKIDYHIQLFYHVLQLGGFPMHGEHGHLTPMGCFLMLHATAAQRAEAFLRTIGKWEEDSQDKIA